MHEKNFPNDIAEIHISPNLLIQRFNYHINIQTKAKKIYIVSNINSQK